MKQAASKYVAAVISAVGIFSTTISVAQQPKPTASSQFEVATIKPGDPKSEGSSTNATGDQFHMVNTPLRQWVKLALSVQDYALKAPSWLDTSRFDLNAKLPATVPADHYPVPEMMKALLIERFGLKWHEELSTVTGYELIPDKKVLLQPTGLLERLHGHGSSSGPTLIGGTNMSMSELAEALANAVGRPVTDATHLSGGYDIKIRWRPTDDAELARQRQYGKQDGFDVDNLPNSLFDALREQLGLRLQSAQVPSKIVVVDNLNRQPTPN